MSWLVNTTANATAGISLDCKGHNEGIIIWICVTAVCFVFGFPAVVAILLDMFQKGRKGTSFTPMDVFISNHTVMDGLFLLSLLPQLYKVPYGQNVAYGTFCRVIYSFNLCGRPLFITCIALDCYLAVVHPVMYRTRKSLTPRVLTAVGVWTLTIFVGLYFATTRDEVLEVLETIVFFLITLPVIGFCDCSILWTLKRSNPGGRGVHPQKKKALQIIITNAVVTFISYLPPIVILSVCRLLSLDVVTFNCVVFMPAIGITLAGNTVSHFLYLYNLGKLDWLQCWKQN